MKIKIRDEKGNEENILEHEHKSLIETFVSIIMLVIFFYLFYYTGGLIMMIVVVNFCVVLFVWGDEIVTFDEGLKRVVKEHRWKKTQAIHFSDIKEILIDIYYNKDYETGSDYKTYNIQLNTINNYYFLAYSPSCYKDALKVAEKISKITNREISEISHNQPISESNPQQEPESKPMSKELHNQTLRLEQGWKGRIQ